MTPISIVLPAYNTPKDILKRCIVSVLNQNYINYELIIVDDGSLPTLQFVINEFNDARIKYFRLDENSGVGKSHNYGIKKSQNDLIAFICHDDEWLPDKLEKQIKCIQEHNLFENGFGLLYSNIYFMEEGIFQDIKSNFENHSGNLYELCLYKGFIHTSTIITTRKVFEDVGLYDESGVLIDWDFYIRLSAKYKIYCLNERLVRYNYSSLGVTHHKSIHGTNAKAGNDIIKMFHKHKKAIMQSSIARKVWSIRMNMKGNEISNNGINYAMPYFMEGIQLNPFWRGNYFDLIKSLIQ